MLDYVDKVGQGFRAGSARKWTRFGQGVGKSGQVDKGTRYKEVSTRGLATTRSKEARYSHGSRERRVNHGLDRGGY
jgi:hypothetical protein